MIDPDSEADEVADPVLVAVSVSVGAEVTEDEEDEEEVRVFEVVSAWLGGEGVPVVLKNSIFEHDAVCVRLELCVCDADID